MKKFLALVFAFLLLTVFSSQYWHSLALKDQQFSMFLNSFDSQAVNQENVCFNVGFLSSAERTVSFRAETSGKILFKELLRVDGAKSKEYCFLPEVLKEGDNTVKLSAEGRTLFFHVEKSKAFSGKQAIVLEGESSEVAGINWLNAFFGVLLIALLLGILFLAIPAKSIEEKACFSILAFCALAVFNFLILDLLKLVSAVSIIVLLVLEVLVLFYFFRKQGGEFSEDKVRHYKTFNLMEALPFLLVIFLALFLHFFTTTHLTFFNSFYERSTQIVIENQGLTLKDPLSHLGERAFAFIPGYFMLEASISFITGLQGTALFALMLAFAGLLFLYSVFFVMNALGLEKHKGLAFVLLIANAFIFNFLIFTPRHLIAFSLLLLAFGFFAKFKDWRLAGIVLGLAAFFQVPLLLIFPLLCFFASREFDFKLLLKSFLAGLAVFALLFLPNFLKFGLPGFAVPEDWGYLLVLPLDFIIVDQAVLVIVLLALLLGEFLVFSKGKRPALGSFKQKLLVGIIILIAVEALISYRLNVLSAFLLTVLIVDWVDFKKFSQRIDWVIVGFVFIVGLLFIALFLPQAVIPKQLENSSQFLKTHSKSFESVLADPFFGHSLEYLAGRKVLADLWVEYADAGKLSDSYNFLKTGDSRILEKYGIKFVINQKNTVFEKAIGNPVLQEPLEFPSLNKVYDDGLIFVHWVP